MTKLARQTRGSKLVSPLLCTDMDGIAAASSSSLKTPTKPTGFAPPSPVMCLCMLPQRSPSSLNPCFPNQASHILSSQCFDAPARR